ncbi:MAG: hypothetical protein ACW96X_10985, partial [Promethearchaeota archaeon]
MFFQPSAPDPWATGGYRIADTLIWIQIVIAAVFAFFLLVEYLNTHKTHHLVWAFALIATWIVFHQVTLLGTYTLFRQSVIAGLSVFIPGAIAAGLLYVLMEDTRILGKIKVATLFSFLILVMTVGITMLSLENIQGFFFIDPWFPLVLTMATNLASAIVIIGLPIYTTVKTKETTESAYLISVGGVLMSMAGIILGTVYFGVATAEFAALGMLSWIFVSATVFIAFGMLYEKKWNFNIPGIEFEEARRREIKIPSGKPQIGALLGLVGSILIVVGSIVVYPILFTEIHVPDGNTILVALTLLGLPV